MLKKTVLVTLITILFPPTLSASYSLLDDDILLASKASPSAPGEEDQPREGKKSPYVAAGMAVAPIPASLLIMYLQIIAGSDDWSFWDDPEAWMEYLVSVFPASLTIFTVPAHMYAETSIYKLTIFTVIKAGFWAVAATAIPSDYPFEPSFTIAKMMTLVFGLGGVGAAYLYELIEIPRSVKRRNEALLRNSLFITPLAGKGEYRLSLVYRF